MTRDDVLVQIYLLTANILTGSATVEDIRRVTMLAIENGCETELLTELKDVSEKLLHKPL